MKKCHEAIIGRYCRSSLSDTPHPDEARHSPDPLCDRSTWCSTLPYTFSRCRWASGRAWRGREDTRRATPRSGCSGGKAESTHDATPTDHTERRRVDAGSHQVARARRARAPRHYHHRSRYPRTIALKHLYDPSSQLPRIPVMRSSCTEEGSLITEQSLGNESRNRCYANCSRVPTLVCT
jgi:hypothetical protein